MQFTQKNFRVLLPLVNAAENDPITQKNAKTMAPRDLMKSPCMIRIEEIAVAIRIKTSVTFLWNNILLFVMCCTVLKFPKNLQQKHQNVEFYKIKTAFQLMDPFFSRSSFLKKDT